MSEFDTVVVAVPPGPIHWKLYFSKGVQLFSDSHFVCDLVDAPMMTAREVRSIEDYLFVNHSMVVTSPWRYEIEYWDADIEEVAPADAGRVQYYKHYVYRGVANHVDDEVTVQIIDRPIHDGVSLTQKLAVGTGMTNERVDQLLRNAGAERASQWEKVPGGRLEKARIVYGSYFTEEIRPLP